LLSAGAAETRLGASALLSFDAEALQSTLAVMSGREDLPGPGEMLAGPDVKARAGLKAAGADRQDGYVRPK
jgi:hypothetical protein